MTQPAPSAALPETYFGAQTSHEHCEVLAIQHIDRRVLALEVGLYEKKWFDYRLLHPVQATYLMTHHYNRAFGNFIGVALDTKRRFTAAFKGKDIMAHREKLSFWKLRQKIDELGMRYEFFLREAMKWHLARGWGKGSLNPPRPCHLTGNDEMILDICNAWSAECKAKIQYARDPAFHASAFTGSAAQLAYEQFLVAQIAQRRNPMYALHAALYVLDVLRVETAIEHFGAETVAQAAQYCLDDISQH